MPLEPNNHHHHHHHHHVLDLRSVYESFKRSTERHEMSRLEAVLPITRVRAATDGWCGGGGKGYYQHGGVGKRGGGKGGGGSGSGKRIPGRVQIANLVSLLDKMGYTRSATQKEIHKGMVASVLTRVFQHESDTEMKLAMQDYGLKETSQQFMVLCPRRHGKTVATALFIAAYLLSIPTCTVSVYSTARRASQELLNMIKKMVATLPMAKSFETVNNQETLELSINGDKRRCSSYPGCSRTLRGTGGDLIVLEEAAYIDESIFNEVVIPLLEIEVTSVIAISTPSTEDNYYSKLRDLRTKAGVPVFTVFTAKRMCPVCVAEGKDTCVHLEVDKAPWKSGGKRDIVEALYGANTVLAKRELEGTVMDDMQSAYSKRMVHATFDAPRIRFRGGIDPPKVVYVAIDPSGGGASKFSMASLSLYQLGTRVGDTIFSSQVGVDDDDTNNNNNNKRARLSLSSSSLPATTAVASTTTKKRLSEIDPGQHAVPPVGFVVHGLENEPIMNRDNIWAVVVGHVRKLRQRYPAGGTLICVGVENNLGNEASHIAHMLRGEENLVCLAEGKHGKSGFCTTNARKHEYFSLLEMSMAEGCLHFLDELVANDGDACLLELKSQIMAFKRVASSERSAFTDRKITFSGKVDGTGNMASHRLCDDLILSLQMCMYVSLLVYRKNSVSFPYGRYVTH